MFTIVLLEPQIPPNTGSTGRLCGATNACLHIVGKLGFELSDKTLKRAGLDYWNHIRWKYFPDLDNYLIGRAPYPGGIGPVTVSGLYSNLAKLIS